MQSKKFTVIGAGGVFTCGLLVHLAREAERLSLELDGVRIQFALMDVDSERLARAAGLGRRVLEESGCSDHIAIEAYREEDGAIRDADIVLFIRSFRAQEARNIEIARRHGVAGGHEGPACLGLARFALPEADAMARKILRLGKPGVRMIKFCNPTDILAQAVQMRTGLTCWGWCGAPDNLREAIAGHLDVLPARVTRLRSVGVNHFSYVTELEIDGRPAMEMLRQSCALKAPTLPSGRLRSWMEWVRDTGWPYLTIGHPAPWNEPQHLPELWTNPEAPEMLEAIDRQLACPRIDQDLLVNVFGWEATTGLAMANLIGALWGKGIYEVGWQLRNEGTVPGMPADAWIERTMRVVKGTVVEVDYKSLPEELEAPVRLAAIQCREIGRAIADDDKNRALRALALNPFSCPMQSARPYVEELWARSAGML